MLMSWYCAVPFCKLLPGTNIEYKHGGVVSWGGGALISGRAFWRLVSRLTGHCEGRRERTQRGIIIPVRITSGRLNSESFQRV